MATKRDYIVEAERYANEKLGKRVKLSDFYSWDGPYKDAEYTVFYDGTKVGYIEPSEITDESLVQFILTQIGAK
jgi:hypothetical protein